MILQLCIQNWNENYDRTVDVTQHIMMLATPQWSFFYIIYHFLKIQGGSGSGGLYPPDWHTDIDRHLDCSLEALLYPEPIWIYKYIFYYDQLESW